LKIQYISSWNKYCGIAFYTKYLTEGLKTEFCVSKPIEKETLKFKGRAFREWVNRECDKVKLHGDLIHFQWEMGLLDPRFMFHMALRFKGKVPLIITCHMLPFHLKFQHMFQLFNFMFEKLIVHTDLQLQFLKSLNVDAVKIPHGTFIPGKIDKDRAREELGLDKSKILLLTHGFIDWSKGYHQIVKLMPKLIEKYDIELACIGSIHPLIRDYAKQAVYDYVKRVMFEARNLPVYFKIGLIDEDELSRWIAASDILIYPYLKGGEGLSSSGNFHRAIGFNKPVIASDSPRLSELNKVALTYPAESERGLYAALTYLLENEDFMDQIREQIYQYALETSWSKIAGRHLELYKETEAKPLPNFFTQRFREVFI